MNPATLAPDKEQIRRALQVFHADDGIVELRALFQRGRKRTAAGYFDAAHRDALIEHAAELNAQGAAVYVVLNPLDPQLLGRYANRVEDYAQATATDANVTRRHWLLIDIDPQRPKDTSASAEQFDAAKDRARKVYAYLLERGWSKPVVAESGNGLHLLSRIELPNDNASRDLIKGCLEALAAKFDDDAVKIDRSVFNAARIVKLHGTIANKGDNVPAAPWRLSRLSRVPDEVQPVPLEKLQALAAEVPAPERPKPNGHDRAVTGKSWTDADVSAFLQRGGIEVLGEPAPHDGSLRWRLKRCPFNPDHGLTEAAVFLRSDGVLGFKCQHNSCADKHWSDLRELVDGPRESRQPLSRNRLELPASHGETGTDGTVQPQDRAAGAPAPWPATLDEAAYHGMLGEIVRMIEPQTEADPMAILLQAIVTFGATVGRGPHVRVEGDEHHGALYAVIVGESSKARKGTSAGRVREVFSRSRYRLESVEGLSSGEGLKYHVRDEREEQQYDKKTKGTELVLVDPGVADKRLLIVESEFAQALRQTARSGNTLSPTVRSAWDTGNLRTLTKNDPIVATGAHICIVGHITIPELRAELTQTDKANGFANRFLFALVKRSKLLPFGGARMDADTLTDLGERIDKAVEHARDLRVIGMTEAAKVIWAAIYAELSQGQAGLLGAVTARSEAQTLRLALVYALADCANAIDAPHLMAALAVIKYVQESAAYVFGDSLGDPVADELLGALRRGGDAGLTRTEIRDLFKRHQRAERVSAALDLLASRGLAHRTEEQTGGRPSEVWRAATKATKATKGGGE